MFVNTVLGRNPLGQCHGSCHESTHNTTSQSVAVIPRLLSDWKDYSTRVCVIQELWYSRVQCSDGTINESRKGGKAVFFFKTRKERLHGTISHHSYTHCCVTHCWFIHCCNARSFLLCLLVQLLGVIFYVSCRSSSQTLEPTSVYVCTDTWRPELSDSPRTLSSVNGQCAYTQQDDDDDDDNDTGKRWMILDDEKTKRLLLNDTRNTLQHRDTKGSRKQKNVLKGDEGQEKGRHSSRQCLSLLLLLLHL